MIRLKISSLCSKLHFLAIGVFLLALGPFYSFFYLIWGIYSAFIIFKAKIKYSYIVVMGLYAACFFSMQNNSITNDLKTIEGKIDAILPKENNYHVYVVNQNKKYLIYIKDIENLKPGYYINVSVSEVTITPPSFPTLFDYAAYLKSSGIDCVYYGNKFSIIKEGFTIQRIQFEIEQFFSLYPEPLASYAKTLLLCRNTFASDFKDDITSLGIAHLFVSSGLHVSIFAAILAFICQKIWDNDYFVATIVSIVLIGYLVICFFALSIFRAVLMYVVRQLFSILKLPFTALDSLAIAFIVILLWKPSALSLTSFQLTFLISFLIIIIPFKEPNKRKLAFKINLLCFLGSLPIVANINYEVNLLALFITPLLSFCFSLLIIPGILIALVFPAIVASINYIYIIFNNIISFFNNFNGLIFAIGKLHIVLILIYYLLGYFFLVAIDKKKQIKQNAVIFTIFLFILFNQRFFNPFNKVTFLSVGQGDTSFIEVANNKAVIVIDAFGDISLVLKSLGIKKIDYLILTHDHLDHTGKASELMEKMEVESILTHPYATSLINQYNAKGVAHEEIIKIGNCVITLIPPPYKDSNENNNSLVAKVVINNQSFLFTGDIEKEREQTLLLPNIDILKVPHHGSSTSSSLAFLEATKPQIAIFSYGLNNSYGHPDKDVVSRYEAIKRYHLALDGSVVFRILGHYVSVNNYPP